MPALTLIGKQLELSAVATPKLIGRSESGAAQLALRNIARVYKVKRELYEIL